MITVVGSANIDMITETDIFPLQGETVRGKGFQTSPGGKGANQAVACARLGEEVQLVGTVGSDIFGTTIIENLQTHQVGTTYIERVEGSSGVAVILLTAGDNRIISIPGTNHSLTASRVKALRDVLENSKLVMLQLEIPTDAIWQVLHICHELEVPVLMDPAPAIGFQLEFMPYVRYLTPNETECEQIFDMSVEEAVAMYPNQLLVTLGEAGVCYHNGEKPLYVEAVKANVVDTTGAGDTFNGALASQLINQRDLHTAIEFSTAAAALSVEKLGAQGGMPTAKDVLTKLRNT